MTDTTTVRYTEPTLGTEYVSDGEVGGKTSDRPEGGQLGDYYTTQEPYGTMLYFDLLRLVGRAPRNGVPRVLITTEGWWTGWSEYTVTDSWGTVVVSMPEWGWEKRWDSVPELYRDLAEVAV